MKIGKIKFSIWTFQFAISNIMGDVLEAQTPRVNGRHASMDATRQWMSRVNGRHASMDISRQWTPRLCKLRMLIVRGSLQKNLLVGAEAVNNEP